MKPKKVSPKDIFDWEDLDAVSAITNIKDKISQKINRIEKQFSKKKKPKNKLDA
jgi:hypothetical protein